MKKVNRFTAALLTGFCLILLVGGSLFYQYQKTQNQKLQEELKRNEEATEEIDVYVLEIEKYKEELETETSAQHISSSPCINTYDEKILANLDEILSVKKNISNGLVLDPEIQKYTDIGGKIYQVCIINGSELGFVIYGEFGKNNNFIGIYNESGIVVSDERYNPSSGDIGLCRIDGDIEGNLLYVCGGGDGPGGWSSTYLLNRSTGEVITLKSCTFDANRDPQRICTVDILGLGE